MCEKYEDFITTYEKLFHLQSSESIDDTLNLIKSILISKYKRPAQQIIKCIFIAMQSNPRSLKSYIDILNQISSLYSISFQFLKIKSESLESFLSYNNNNGHYHFEKKDIPELDNEICSLIFNDQIDDFRRFLLTNKLPKSVLDLSSGHKISLLEACAFYGSVNIFYFLLSNYPCVVTLRCLHNSIIGGNIDIINECLKIHNLDCYCFLNAIKSHNNKFLEYIFEKELINFDQDFLEKNYINAITSSQNLKAVFLLYQAKKNIIPWCAAFPQTLDIIKAENIDLNMLDFDCKNLLHYASYFNNIDICEFLFSSSQVYHRPVNAIDINNQTALHYAAANDCAEIAKILISNDAFIKDGHS
ncbi:hypothetical protein TVAG_075940 [Trichomonas vaginalis G3]|uniref:DUF3447 domain-containing protein n=1 Tax=Trichomonas vaginalis (strain ATCC PRA-98 / G3) TaxID=412133 RepID=A2D9J1_TRIV3|nr:spectrin binding [Trichomonas vaginalis G3]EAY22847.1 hypothetical protein TVAG_075940 [Trichomonas vaginalis G3]KAI5527440.1 spectrin binding [Trichomonas vaginalis G3]|eukprot:XP_001583833.1 hypothetical protein [Trichomonas vaginalis G3]